jgi:hypothetical protein
MHLALVMVYVLIQMKLALVMAYLHIKMHLAPTMVYTFFKMLNLAWNMVYIVLGNSHGLLCPFRICTTLNVPIKTLVMIYISIKMQLTSTMAYVFIETHLALCVPIETLVMVYIPIGNCMALTITYVFIGTCFPFIFSSNLDYGLHLHIQSSL